MFGLPAMLLTLLLLFGSAIVASISFFTGRIDILAKVVKLSLVWGAAYLSLLIGTSTSSDKVVLEPGARKAFCGFHIDCHLGIRVTNAWRSSGLIADDPRREFLFVDIEVSSDAKQVPLRLRDPRFVVIAEDGRRFERALRIEHQVATRLGQAHSVEVPLPPDGVLVKTLIYEMPRDARNLRLHATNGEIGERFAELFLIGDEDSLFHEPVLLGLEETGAEST